MGISTPYPGEQSSNMYKEFCIFIHIFDTVIPPQDILCKEIFWMPSQVNIERSDTNSLQTSKELEEEGILPNLFNEALTPKLDKDIAFLKN